MQSERRGHPAQRSQGPLPEHAQERYLEWLASRRSPAVDPSAAACAAGSPPAAAAAPVEEGAAASQPLRRPDAASAGLSGTLGVTEGLAAAWHAVAIRRE
eukprot:1479909-Pyramimonas_sp.AAC.1